MLDKIIALRQELHAHPKASMQERPTLERIMAFLGREAPRTKIVDHGAWFYALHDEGAEETYLFRADVDAILNEDGSVYHGCGHDGHSAILAGLAARLDGESLGRNIVFLFQHAEETGQGAAECLPVFSEQQIDYAFALHGFAGGPVGHIQLRPGTAFCASTGLILKLQGKQSHASEPELGRNPAYLIAELTHLLEPLSQFKGFQPTYWQGVDFQNMLMATIIYLRVGEQAFGVSPANGEMGMTLRAYHEAEIDQLIELIEDFVATAAAKRELEYHFESIDRFPETVNDPELTERVIQFLQDKAIDFSIDPEPKRGSEDFGHLAKQVPSVYFMLGLGEQALPPHHRDFEFVDAALEHGIALFETIARHGV